MVLRPYPLENLPTWPAEGGLKASRMAGHPQVECPGHRDYARGLPEPVEGSEFFLPLESKDISAAVDAVAVRIEQLITSSAPNGLHAAILGDLLAKRAADLLNPDFKAALKLANIGLLQPAASEIRSPPRLKLIR